jgi:hypothetical protein
MLLGEAADEIKPAMVLVQMHERLINNSHALESGTTADNQLTPLLGERPRGLRSFRRTSVGPLWPPWYCPPST